MTIGNHTTSNDITGDPIQSKQLSKQGRDNWDDIDWGARAREAEVTISKDTMPVKINESEA